MQDQIPALYSVCNTTATWSHNSHHLQSVLITLWLTLSYKHSHTQHIKSTKLHLMVFLCWKTEFLYAHCTQMHARTCVHPHSVRTHTHVPRMLDLSLLISTGNGNHSSTLRCSLCHLRSAPFVFIRMHVVSLFKLNGKEKDYRRGMMKTTETIC